MSRAWPEADCDGEKMTVLVNARQRSNSWTTGSGEARKSSSTTARLSSRTTKSVNGSEPDFGQVGIAAEQTFQAGIASAPNQPARMLRRRIRDGQAESLPVGDPLLLRRLQEQLGRPQLVLP